MIICSSISLYDDGSSLLRFVVLVSSLSLLRKGLFTCLNFVDYIIFSMSSLNSFDSSIGEGFLVDFGVGDRIKVEEP